MTHHRPGWATRSGQNATQEKNRRKRLVRDGLASLWLPLRGVEEAGRKAGL
jgi:hypothetical protein